MNSPPDDLPPQDAPARPPDWPSHPAIESRQPRNLLLLAIHQIVLRMGWIFKTESVIMPAFLDAVTGGSGWMRGCLPVLNRLGQGLPPLFSANFLRALRWKKRALVTFTVLMSLPFVAMSFAWFAVGSRQRDWMSGLFLALYFAFFVLYGLYLVAFGIVQGKLIRPTRRGRLILLSTFWGAIPATLVALWLMPDWLKSSSPRSAYVFASVGVCFFVSTFLVLYGLSLVSFGTLPGKPARLARRGYLILLSTFCGAVPATLVTLWLMPDWLVSASPRWGRTFAFVAVCFLLSGLIGLLLFEPGDDRAKPPVRRPGSLAETIRVLRKDANLRRLVVVAILVGTGLILLPHYQALARVKLGLSGAQLIFWVVTQNAAVATFSLLVGPLADRRGYRLTVRLLIFAAAVAPAFAILLPQLPKNIAAKLFWLVYVALGVAPLVPRAILNYALEICKPAAHARYQSIAGLGVAAPFVLSPGIGWLVDAVGFEWVFSSTILLVLLGGLLTFRLEEPREGVRDERAAEVGTPE